MSTNNRNTSAVKKNLLNSFGNMIGKRNILIEELSLDEKPQNGNGQSNPETLSDMQIPEQPQIENASAQALEAVIQEEGTIKKAPPPRLIQTLIEKGSVAKEKINQAIEIQRKTNDKRRLTDILVDDLGEDRELIFQTIARYYSFETIDPTVVFGNKERLQFIRQVLDSLPPYYYEMAIRRKVLPYEMYTNGYDKIIVVTPDTTHPEVHLVARAFQFPKYELKHVSLANWNELWRQLAFDQGAKQLGLDIEDEFVQLTKDESEKELERSLEDEIGRGKLNEIVESLLADGVRTGASDIHVIPKGANRTEFHFRIDGKLSLWSAITDMRAEAVITVIKDRAKNLDRFEKFLSQDGFAQRMIDNKIFRFRFSTMPIYGSDLRSKLESIVIRILRGADDAMGLESLGMDHRSLDVFRRSIRKTQGMIIFTGPTGSGKTTSQHAAIQEIMDPGINIITIEDPVEYLIEGCRQVKLNHKLDFEGALRGLLRHDPDVVMVGEMRDRTTAEIAVKLANTGHLIFSTLHTNDSISAITRLYNMGIEPFLLAYTINIIVAQRLLRKLCDRCKMIDNEIDIELLMEAGLSEKEIETTQFYKPIGCAHCIKGYRGRVGIYEAFAMDKEIRKIILKSKDSVDEESLRTHALQNGMHTLRQSALDLVKQGITSFETAEGMLIED
jgi:type IV pilus assembly protein PilB